MGWYISTAGLTMHHLTFSCRITFTRSRHFALELFIILLFSILISVLFISLAALVVGMAPLQFINLPNWTSTDEV